MTWSPKSTRNLGLSVALALLCIAAFADGVAASPAWKLNGTTLAGSEETLSHAVESSLTIPGLTTTCKPTVYGMTISNKAGTGEGSLTEMPLKNCFTASEACAVKSMTADKLPWSAHLTTIGAQSYLVIEDIKLSILYKGIECALGGVLVVAKGTAGGLVDNATESVTFDAASFSATGTSLTALGTSTQWSGAFTMLATGPLIGQSLSVS